MSKRATPEENSSSSPAQRHRIDPEMLNDPAFVSMIADAIASRLVEKSSVQPDQAPVEPAPEPPQVAIRDFVAVLWKNEECFGRVVGMREGHIEVKWLKKDKANDLYSFMEGRSGRYKGATSYDTLEWVDVACVLRVVEAIPTPIPAPMAYRIVWTDRALLFFWN